MTDCDYVVPCYSVSKLVNYYLKQHMFFIFLRGEFIPGLKLRAISNLYNGKGPTIVDKGDLHF